MVVVAKQRSPFAANNSLHANLLYQGEGHVSSEGLMYLRPRYYSPDTGQFNRVDPFSGNLEDPQSLHKYTYAHDDPINNVDPTGEFALIAGLLGAIGFGLGAGIASFFGLTAFGTTTGGILGLGAVGFLAGLGISSLIPVAQTNVSANDVAFANGQVVPTPTDQVSINNQRLLAMPLNPVNRKRLLEVLKIARSTSIALFTSETCNCFVHDASVEIAKLNRLYWDNSDYIVEQIEWGGVPAGPLGRTQEHASLRIRFKGSGQVAYFDNGALGDSILLPRLSGGLYFPEAVPAGWFVREKFSETLDNIKPRP